MAAAVIGSFLWLRASNNTSLAPNTTTTTNSDVSIGTTQVQADTIAMNRGCPASTAQRVNTKSWTTAPSMSIDTSKTYTADVSTTAGAFTITLDAAAAPTTVNNFVFLARQHYYDCVIFHRVIPGFMIQGGDPTGTGMGGPGYKIKDEFSNHNINDRGAVAMANAGAGTSGSQFFIVYKDTTLPPSYTIWGKVVSGLDVVTKVAGVGVKGGGADGVPAQPFVITKATISETG